MIERFPRWWFFYLVGKSLFYVVGIISLVFYGTAFLAIAERIDEYIIGFGCWILLVLPYVVNYRLAKNRRQKIQTVLDKVKDTGFFNPDQTADYWLFWDSTYLGFDFKKGTILYIRIYPGNVMDVVGLDAYSLVRTELDGTKLKLFTKLATLPMIPLKTGAASSIANHLHGMNHKAYSYNFNFQDIVNKKRVELENLTGVPVPELI